MGKAKTTPEERKLAKFIVSKFMPDLPASQWAKQRAMANKLIKKFPDLKFWQTLPRPSSEVVKFFSLSWFISNKLGAHYLNDHSLIYNRVEEPTKKDYNFQEEKIGEDFKVKNKPKTPLDFFE